MPTPVVMPQNGESIAEGTIGRWLKKVGDTVDRDEPLFEISTDKVDAEIPSPTAGVLTEITAQEGETVAVNSVVANIAAAGEPAAAPAPAAAPSAATKGAEKAAASTQPQGDGAGASSKAPRANGSEATDEARSRPDATLSNDELRRQKSSPLVRRIAREHNVDITTIPGSGIGGRVTKHDILGFIESGAPEQPAPAAVGQVPPSSEVARGGPAKTGDRVEIQPLSVMRKKIAEHMVLSR